MLRPGQAVYGYVGSASGPINLQATLSAASVTSEQHYPHHPITCTGDLYYCEDGSFGCDHAEVGPEDERTVYCIQHSIALLLIEIASNTL